MKKARRKRQTKGAVPRPSLHDGLQMLDLAAMEMQRTATVFRISGLDDHAAEWSRQATAVRRALSEILAALGLEDDIAVIAEHLFRTQPEQK